MLDLIQWRARKTPEAQALFFNGRWYTYRELEGRANRLANRLLSLGIKRGDCIAVIAHNHPVHFDLLLAAPKIGVVFTPVNPHIGEAEMVALAKLAKPAMVFADSRYHAAAAATGAPWTRLSDYRDWLNVGSLDLPPVQPLSVDDAHIQFFTPRGIAVLPYRQVLLNARHSADVWKLSARDSTVHCLPCFGPELTLLCLPLLYRGGRVVLMSEFDADEYLGHLALHRVSVAALSPLMLRHLTDYGDFDEADLSSLNWLATVGAPAALPIHAALTQRGLQLRMLMPLAEAGPNLFNAVAGDSEARPELLGLPMPDLGVKVCNQDGHEVLEGEPGELKVSGAMVFSRYHDDKEATDAVLRDGWLATGIAVRKDHDGQYLHWGRISDSFVIGGVQVHPGEIEAALFHCESVLDCAVTRIADATRGSAILAVIVLQDGVQRDDESLARELAELLPEAKRPAHYLRAKMLPRDVWGVVDRSGLAAAYLQSRIIAKLVSS
ncbi:MAG: AMP-binding protein [Pseudomonadota bacterium]